MWNHDASLEFAFGTIPAVPQCPVCQALAELQKKIEVIAELQGAMDKSLDATMEV